MLFEHGKKHRRPSGLLSDLAELDLSQNQVSSIAADAFEPLGVSLRVLSLRGNRLKSLPDGVFSALAALQVRPK